jgi:hypothetical protein
MKLVSTAFANEETIPTRFTCEGDDISPPLSWSGFPKDTKSLALILDDPDAPMGTFTHWLLYNIPTNLSELEEGISLSKKLPEGIREGFNDFGNQGYGGPCPPRNKGAHRYYFRLYALNQALELSGRVTRRQLLDAIHNKILGETDLMGRFERQ